jgi:hypothetical protein
MLTVSDGTHMANLALLGQYAAGWFTAAADANGGTMIGLCAANRPQPVPSPGQCLALEGSTPTKALAPAV